MEATTTPKLKRRELIEFNYLDVMDAMEQFVPNFRSIYEKTDWATDDMRNDSYFEPHANIKAEDGWKLTHEEVLKPEHSKLLFETMGVTEEEYRTKVIFWVSW